MSKANREEEGEEEEEEESERRRREAYLIDPSSDAVVYSLWCGARATTLTGFT